MAAWAGRRPVMLDEAWTAATSARAARQDAGAARRAADDAARPGAIDHGQAGALGDAAQLADANAVLAESRAFRAADARLTTAAR
jgi:hypothetical protein